jgi:hypothetical protein
MAEDDAEYDLVMPFVVVASKGGPYDDDAYVAGYEMGLIAAALAQAPSDRQATIRTANVPQADLLAMQYGYRYTAERSEDVPEWTHVKFESTTKGW